MKTLITGTILATLALSACATSTAGARSCDAGPAQQFVGQKAGGEAALDIRRASGARVIRWAPPRTAMTMEFMEGRVTIAYDDDMNITTVTCG